MDPFDPITVQYTWFQRVGIPLGTLMFAAMGIWILIESGSIFKDSIPVASVFSVLGLWFLYLAFVGFKLSRNLSLVVTADETGMTVSDRSGSNRYSWEELAPHKFDLLHRVLRIVDSRGEELFTIDGDAPGCHELRRVLGQVQSNYGGRNA